MTIVKIVHAMVRFKDVKVLDFSFEDPFATATIEQISRDPVCPACQKKALIKDRPSVALRKMSGMGNVPEPLQVAVLGLPTQ